MLSKVKKKLLSALKKTNAGRQCLSNMVKKKKINKMKLEFVNVLANDDKVIIFGVDFLAQQIDMYLEKKGINTRFFVELDVEEESYIRGKNVKPYKSISQLDDFKTYKILVVPCKTVIYKIEALLEMGLEWENIVLNSTWTSFIEGKEYNAYDVQLGFTRVDDLSGFTIFEDKENSKEKYTIVTLGNSTTAPYTSNIKSWSEILFNELTELGLAVRVICGGMSSYHSGHELLKLLRDVLPLKPDMVLSYSGINDTPCFQRNRVCKEYPFVMLHHKNFLEFAMKHANKKGYFQGAGYSELVNNITLGVVDSEDYAERWVSNERKMHALCREFNIKFYGFLQPVRDYGGYIKTGEYDKASYKKVLEERTKQNIEWYDKTRVLIRDIDYIVDFSELFCGKKHIYFDYCHMFENGNRKIAQEILQYIIKDIRNERK